MMRTKTIIGLFILSFAVSACSTDFLEDLHDYDAFTDEVYKDEYLATGYLDYLYFCIYPANGAVPTARRGFDGDGYSADWNKLTEEQGGSTKYTNPYSSLTYDDVSNYFGVKMSNSIANNTWTRIRQCNLFLQNIDIHGDRYLKKEVRDRLKGQAYYWRAWQYFDLVRLYGGVPIVLTAENLVQGDPEQEIPRSTTSACIEQICNDLDSATVCLPAKWDKNNWGRVSGVAASALKARVLLTWASPLFNRSDDRARWQKAYDAFVEAKSIADANGCGLYGENSPGVRAKAWSQMFVQGENGYNNPEIIKVHVFSSSKSGYLKNNGWEKNIRPGGIVGGSGYSTTIEMIDDFPMADGKRPGESAHAYDTLKFFRDRDPRFYRTYAFTGSFWPYADSLSNASIWNYVWYESEEKAVLNDPNTASPNGLTEFNNNNTGVYVRKMSQDGKIAKLNWQYSGTEIIEYRYAELLLGMAEAATALGKTDEAYALLRRIRHRASLPAGDGNYGLKSGMSRAEMHEAILYERRIELAYEGHRFYDLHRWMLFDGGTDRYALDQQPWAHGNTCDYLKVKPLNGQRRTGIWLILKSNQPGGGGSIPWAATGIKNDPVYKAGLRPGFDGAVINPAIGRVDPDASDEYWNKGIETLSEFYDNYLARHRRLSAVDGSHLAIDRFYIQWKPENYFLGIRKDIQNANPWLEQTIGWLTPGDSQGTFDPLK